MTVSIDKLLSELSPDIVSTEPELISLYSQDVFGAGAPAKAVVKPTCIEELQRLGPTLQKFEYASGRPGWWHELHLGISRRRGRWVITRYDLHE